jgi:hypothetical protein
MGRPRKCNIKSSHSNESISDIFEAIKNEEELTKSLKTKKTNKTNKKGKKNSNNSNNSDSTHYNKIIESPENNKVEKSTVDPKKIEEKNKITMEKLALITTLCEDYPALKKDKDKIIQKALEEKKQTNKPLYYPTEYTLDKITLEGETYYRDANNNILDMTAKLVGFYKNDGSKYEYMLLINTNN